MTAAGRRGGDEVSASVVFLDTETLGLDPDIHPVWEIGLIVGPAEYTWQIRPTGRELANAHPKALEIGRFEERYDDGHAYQRPDMARILAKAIPAGAHLAGAVISFDEERLRRFLWAHGQPIPWHYHLVDVEALAAGKVGAVPPWDSGELSMAVGVDPQDFDRHTALGDARWAQAIYRAVMGG
jgi:hypothetical protein